MSSLTSLNSQQEAPDISVMVVLAKKKKNPGKQGGKKFVTLANNNNKKYRCSPITKSHFYIDSLHTQ